MVKLFGAPFSKAPPILPLRPRAQRRGFESESVAGKAPGLGGLLLERGEITGDDLTHAITLQTRERAPLGDILVARGAASQRSVSAALATQNSLRLVDLDREPADPRLMGEVAATDCLDFSFVPWRMEGGSLVLAVANPDEIRVILRKIDPKLADLRFVLADKRQIHATIQTHLGDAILARAEARVPAHLSSRTWSTWRSTGLLALGLIVFALLSAISSVGALALLYGLAVLTLIANTTVKASCALIALYRGVRPPAKGIFIHTGQKSAKEQLPKISILVPLFQEENIATVLVERLSRIDYPRELLELCLVVEAEDAVTRRTLQACSLPPWMRVIRVPLGSLKTKPRAMNYALDYTTGDIVGVYDAEDAPDPMQLYKVARKFRDGHPDLACVQGVLSFYNARKNWLSRCFSFEYAGWFRVMLPGLERLKFPIPLGGTTLFFRRDRLIELGAWDAHNVTEDADLGMRLARRGYRTEMIQSVTQEEANSRAWPWVKQRARWIKGYAVTWCVHMRNPKALLRDLGAWKFLGFQVLFLGSLASFLLAPVLWWGIVTTIFALPHPLIDVLPAGSGVALMGFFLACEALTLMVFATAALRLENRPGMAWVLTLPFYFPLATVAAYRGVAELFFRPFYWDKTQHGVYGGDDAQAGRTLLTTPSDRPPSEIPPQTPPQTHQP